jgi:Flp pilus assembly protein TadD
LITVVKRQIDIAPEDVRARSLLANSYAFVGQPTNATQQLEMSVAMRPNDPSVLYNAACTYGILGMKTEALAMFKRAVETGFSDMEWAARDTDLSCLHESSEFEHLLRQRRDSSSQGARPN